jgi:hypothetical protein
MQWLETGDPAVESHVSTCDRCARLLEDTTPAPASFTDLLSAALTPPEDLQSRLAAGISRRLQTREDLRLLAELLGLPLYTVKSLTNPPSEPT